MDKIGAVIVVVVIMVVVYILMLVTMPVVVDIVAVANATATAEHDMTNYPGSSEFLVSTPWILWFVPGTIGMIAIVIILKRP